MLSDDETRAPFATYFSVDAFDISGERLMGRQAAGNSYLKALFNQNYDNVALYVGSVLDNPRDLSISNKMLGFLKNSTSVDDNTNIKLIPYDEPETTNQFGGIFRPDPKIEQLARHRGYFGHDTYSLIGITHTTASHSIMTSLTEIVTSPIMPWDALICTSKSVKDTVEVIHNNYYEYLNFRFGITKKPEMQLPVIPLGINIDEFKTERNRDNIRTSYSINKDDIAIIFVGRISFHAKAHNVPMFLALERLAQETSKKKIHFIMAGWFPNEAIKKVFIEDAAKVCPSVKVIFVDGRDQEKKFDVYAAGDIFFSLTDNIQETFGLTPLEGMASGLPVVVSDWNGYRDTVRDGIDGFRIRTTSYPEELSQILAYRHDLGLDTYDRYCGYHSQFTSVDILEAVKKLKILIEDKDLRRELGNNARKHASEKFSWSVILKSYSDLEKQLFAMRKEKHKIDKSYLKMRFPDRLPPYEIFRSYPSQFLDHNSLLVKNDDINPFQFKELMQSESINFASVVLPEEKDIDLVLDTMNNNNNITFEKLISKTGIKDAELLKVLAMLLKYGYINVKD